MLDCIADVSACVCVRAEKENDRVGVFIVIVRLGFLHTHIRAYTNTTLISIERFAPG